MKATILALGIFATGIATSNLVAEEPKAASDKVVGVSSHDGFTRSGDDLFVTRNGVTEKVTKEMTLSNGVRVMPGGGIFAKDGNKMELLNSQVLTLDGRVVNAPVTEPAAPARVPETSPKQPTTNVAADAARMEAERAAGANKGHIQAGEGVQK